MHYVLNDDDIAVRQKAIIAKGNIRDEAVYVSEYFKLHNLVKFQLLCGLALLDTMSYEGLCETMESQIMHSRGRAYGSNF